MSLNQDQQRRYSRAIMLEEIGLAGQQKLCKSSVLIIGAGALGSLVAMYLGGAGVGRLGICDYDTIDVSNLHRQLAYDTFDLGKKKALTLAVKLNHQNPNVDVDVYDQLITKKNILETLRGYNFVIDASDNPETKYLTADYCRRLKKPYCLAGISGMSAQIMTYLPGTKGYRDVFPEGKDSNSALPCSLGGVLGPVAGIAASIQATEAIKYLIGHREGLLTNRLLVIDALGMNFTVIDV